MNLRKAIRGSIASFLAILLIFGSSHPLVAVEELTDNADNPEVDTFIEADPNIFNLESEEVLFSYELEENVDQISLYLVDYENEEAIGLIEEFNNVGEGYHEHQWDLEFKDLLQNGDSTELEDGRYYIEMYAEKDDEEASVQRTGILVHSENPEIQLDKDMDEETYVTEENIINGQIDVSLTDLEAGEEAVEANYTLKQDEEIYQEDAVTLDEEGNFEIHDALEEGESTLTIEAMDAANNQQEERFEIAFVLPEEEEETAEEETAGEETTDEEAENEEETSVQVQSDESDGRYQDGDRGEHVVDLKKDLTALGFGNFPSDPSTIYGNVTEGVVEDFQSHYGLDVTGEADEATLEKMEEILASSYQDGNSGEHVIELKEDLTKLGFGNFPSAPSTTYGSVTEGVVKDFQEAQGLPASGIADEITLATISDLLAPPYQDGDRGEHIADLKQNLTALGFGNFPSEPSINYGSVTAGVVEDFQSYYGLDVTGHTDEATLEKIEEVLSSSYQDGNSGDHVVELKEDLTRLGFGSFPSAPSTVYGSVTEGVVKDFQEAQGLPVSGIADETTLETINDLLSPPYQNGDQGEHIVGLKQDLTALGFGNFPSEPSINYGSVTAGVVEDFQAYYSLDVTGIADEATLEKMEAVFESSYQDGNSGDYVVQLKEDLTTLGYGNFPADPSTAYGSVTEGVVKDFQEAQGLPVSGIADEITLETISDLLSPPYQNGEQGEHIVALKQDLTALGFGNFPSEPSINYGSVTAGVVEDFQAYYGLDVTGIADEATLEKMEEVFESSYQDGNSGDDVVELKKDLTTLGFGNFPSDPSTVYGSVTEGVVKDFQAHYGLVTNGIADERTLAKIEEILDSPYQDGNSGDYVVELKEDLTALGFGNFPSEPSASYGSVTEGVVEDFQSAYDLPVSGIADEVTLAMISEALENMNEIKIFLDPGHGGHDSGAAANGLQEKDVALDISLHAAEVLEEEYLGVDVMMSRTTDEFIELPDRAAMANDWGADYFVSVHNNSFNGSANGFESFIFDGNVSSTTIEKQEEVHEYIADELDATDRGTKRANFSVLRNTNMPAILLELLFIDNDIDANLLGSAEGRAELGRITANAVAHAWDLERK